MFLDGPWMQRRSWMPFTSFLRARKYNSDYAEPVLSIDEYELDQGYSHTVLSESLVRMKLTSFRRKDQTNLLDMRCRLD